VVDVNETSQENGRRQIVVGMFDERSGDVVGCAAHYAKAFDADLTCVFIEPTSLALGETPQGSLYGGNIVEELGEPEFPDDLLELAEQALDGKDITWSTVARRGTPSTELALLGDEVDALMFVLGTRKPGIRDSMREFLNGSVVAQLSHRQSRPVVVVPLTVSTTTSELPWVGDQEG
jgi:nucleotide-binding universal stress UspA family protein